MSDKQYEPLSEETVRYFAEKGSAWLTMVQAGLARAQEMVASGEVEEPAGGVDPHYTPYAWESTEPEPDAPFRIWRATAEDFATGEGMTVYYAVRRARDADEFRRMISREFGVHFADCAKLAMGVDSPLQFEAAFLSATQRETFGKFDRGEEAPPAMSFYARYHFNYS